VIFHKKASKFGHIHIKLLSRTQSKNDHAEEGILVNAVSYRLLFSIPFEISCK